MPLPHPAQEEISFEFPNLTAHSHITPAGTESEPGYITRTVSPFDSNTLPAFTTSPAFGASPAVFSSSLAPTPYTKLEESKLANSSYIRVPTPPFRLTKALWMPHTSTNIRPSAPMSQNTSSMPVDFLTGMPQPGSAPSTPNASANITATTPIFLMAEMFE